jgi:hypothetical protein
MKLFEYNLWQIPDNIVEGKDSWDDMSTEECMKALRGLRNYLLTASDWTQIIDSPLSDAKRQEWAEYRQSLRDLPSGTLVDPTLIEIPEKPAA